MLLNVRGTFSPLDWLWFPEKYVPKYYEILQMFRDQKSCPYSIHQIGKLFVRKLIGEGRKCELYFVIHDLLL